MRLFAGRPMVPSGQPANHWSLRAISENNGVEICNRRTRHHRDRIRPTRGVCVPRPFAARLARGEQDNGWKLGVLASTADLAKHTIRATIRPFAPRLAAAH